MKWLKNQLPLPANQKWLVKTSFEVAPELLTILTKLKKVVSIACGCPQITQCERGQAVENGRWASPWREYNHLGRRNTRGRCAWSNPIYVRDQAEEANQQSVQAYHDEFEKKAAERRARVQAWSKRQFALSAFVQSRTKCQCVYSPSMESDPIPPGAILHEEWHEDKVVVTAMGPYGVLTAEIDAREFKSWKDFIEYTKIHPLCRNGVR